jgi:dihydrodipicolinate synthase/N-acetylneuraminate lyase
MGNMTKLMGVMAALATPLTSQGDFDSLSEGRLIRHVLGGGIHSIFILGHAGECMAFDRKTRCQVIESARKEIGEQIPLIVGVFDNSTALVLQHARDARERGADFVLTTPPNFYTLTQMEIRDFYIRLAEEGGISVIAYNCPGFANQLESQTVSELAGHPMMAGLKETSNQVTLQKMQLLLKSHKKFTLLSGDEFLFLPAMSIGIKAFIMGGPGNLTPRWCTEILDSFNKGSVDKARAKYLDMINLYDQLYHSIRNPMASVKAGLEMLGLCDRYMAHPVLATSEEDNKRIAALLQEYKVL